MYKPIHLLSDNIKTSCSIDLPIKGHCTPTEICVKTCYARRGTQAWPNPKRKQKYISEYLKGDNIDGLIHECMLRTTVRISGSGDLLIQHVRNIIRLAEACQDTQFWGMTRKVSIAEAINGNLPNLRLLVTVDVSSPKSVWNYEGKLCFGPRRENDDVPDDPRIVTIFPYHSGGRIVGNVPEHEKDCPAVRNHGIITCILCHRCWRWK